MSRNICTIPNCNKTVHGNGLCGLHYQRMWKHGNPLYQPTQYKICIVDGCNNEVRSSGCKYCEKHYGRLRRRGTTQRHLPTQVMHHSGGYILIYNPEHLLTQRHTGSYEYEHRIVYYNTYGEGPFNCYWCNKEISWDNMHIDHLNNNCKDNRLENLVASCPECNQHRGQNKMIQTMRDKHGRWIEFEGKRKLLAQWAKEIGISRSTLQQRIKSGWPLERALTEGRNRCGPKRIMKT